MAKNKTPEQTFLDYVENPTYKQADVAFLGVACDISCTYGKGAWFGPQAFLDASFQLETEVPFYHVPFSDRLHIHNLGIIESPQTIPKAKQKHHWFQATKKITEDMVANVKKEVQQVLKDEKLIMLAGGDHSVTNGVLLALDQKYGAENVTIVHFDAHLDLREAYDALEYSHASVMYNAREKGFPMVQIGMRDHYSKEESDLIVQNKWQKSIFPCPSQPFNFYLLKGKDNAIDTNNMLWDRKATKDQLVQILSQIGTPYVYFSIDVDVLSAQNVPSTGTPLPLGLSFHELQRLLHHIVTHIRKKKLKLVGFDLVEISPMLRDSKKGYVSNNVISPILEIQAAHLAHNMLFWYFEEKFKPNYAPGKKKKKGLL